MSRLAAILLYIVVSTNGQVITVTTTCSDQSLLCPYWAFIGECVRNSPYMLVNCAISCDFNKKCTDTFTSVTCTDLNPSCTLWTSQNQCSLNPYFMNWQCPKSCNPTCGATPAAGITGAAVTAPAAGVTGAAVTAPAAGVTGAAVTAPAAGVTGAAVTAPAAGVTGAAVTAPTSSTDKKNHKPWQDFKAKFAKLFHDDAHEERRFRQFLKALEYIEKNKDKFGLILNKFADLNATEMNDYKGFKPDMESPNATTHLHPENTQVPKAVDWREKGMVTPVKDQGPCGSCFTFGTTGVLEAQMFRKTGKLVPLSEQNMLDCAPTPPLNPATAKEPNNGCNQGAVDDMVKWIQKNGGLNPESSYPYRAGQRSNSTKQACQYDSNNKAAVATGYVNVPRASEEGLRNATATIGPISIAISTHVYSFYHYDGTKIYDDPECAEQEIDHIVLIVGYGTDANGQDYWIIKNTWATDWGDKGYMYMARNTDGLGICRVSNWPTYALV